MEDLYLDDGTKKIFCNMKSKNGREELVSLLQYMKHITLGNPDVTVKDRRIMRLDEIVSEVKQSEEWEEVRVSIYKIGLENGRVEGRQEGSLQMLLQLVKKGRLSQSEAAKEAGLTEEDFLKRMEEVHSSAAVNPAVLPCSEKSKYLLASSDNLYLCHAYVCKCPYLAHCSRK